MHNPRTYGKSPSLGQANDFLHAPTFGASSRNDHFNSRNDLWKTQNKEFLPHDILLEEGDLLSTQNQNSGGGGGEPCEDHCGDDEFFCPESCQCIQEHLRCGENLHIFEKNSIFTKIFQFSDNHVDCEAKGEDEIGCELTEDEIEKIKHECESNPEHVMCPMTLTCIKQSWFCGEILAKFLLKCKKIQYLFLV